jgi:hypothetical protein
LEALAILLETHDFKPGKFHLHSFMSSYAYLHDTYMSSYAYLHATYGIGDDPIYPIIKKLASRHNGMAPIVKDGQLIDCRTVGCAIGWGIVLLPIFKERGLTFSQPCRSGGYDVLGIEYRPPNPREHNVGMYAVERFFDLSTTVAHWLFVAHEYSVPERSNPKAVASRIREVLANPELAKPSYT